MIYHSDRSNVSNQYLTNVFCVAFDHGLDLPVYQVNYEEPDCFLKDREIKDSAFVLMICGNENHKSVDHYLSDSRVKMVIKNYPRMINVAEDKKNSQEYITKMNNKGHQKFIVEEEAENILTIPLGTCNDFCPMPLRRDRNPGGFIGQWTQIREDKFVNVRNCFEGEECPYDFAFYNGFGPFVQIKDLKKNGYKGSLKTDVYSNFMSNSEIAFIPNGQSPETYRLFEAAAAGCIVVHDILPDVWYYDNLPYVPFESTNFKPVKEYIENYKEELKILTGIWWQSTVNPIAVGKKIAETFKSLEI